MPAPRRARLPFRADTRASTRAMRTSTWPTYEDGQARESQGSGGGNAREERNEGGGLGSGAGAAQPPPKISFESGSAATADAAAATTEAVEERGSTAAKFHTGASAARLRATLLASDCTFSAARFLFRAIFSGDKMSTGRPALTLFIPLKLELDGSGTGRAGHWHCTRVSHAYEGEEWNTPSGVGAGVHP